MKIGERIEVEIKITPQSDSTAGIEVTCRNVCYLGAHTIIITPESREGVRGLILAAVDEALKDRL